MNILFVSHSFHPSVGGLESVSLMLAEQFVKQGHQVCVVTQTCHDRRDDFLFRVIRRPGPHELLALTRWCDVMFHNNISLKVAWPLLLIRRPWVVAHHTWMPSGSGLRGLKGRLKQWAIRNAHCISISEAIARHARVPSVVIPNPYNDEMFCLLDSVPRRLDLVFVGRLVSDKGVDILLEALAELRQRDGLTPDLTIVGEGPERPRLERMIENLGLKSVVSFAGQLRGEALVRELNAHSLMVVPSRWNEPFGIVALEGIACGCVVVASDGGGLSDAVGPCGRLFPNGDVEGLTRVLQALLTNPKLLEAHRRAARAHLAGHSRAAVGNAYLRVLVAARGQH